MSEEERLIEVMERLIKALEEFNKPALPPPAVPIPYVPFVPPKPPRPYEPYRPYPPWQDPRPYPYRPTLIFCATPE